MYINHITPGKLYKYISTEAWWKCPLEASDAQVLCVEQSLDQYCQIQMPIQPPNQSYQSKHRSKG